MTIKGGDSPNGWTAYVRAYKERHPDVIPDLKALMQQYIKGIPVQEAKL